MSTARGAGSPIRRMPPKTEGGLRPGRRPPNAGNFPLFFLFMSDLRVYVRDKDGKEISFVIHDGMGCRLASAINEKTSDFESLLKSAYEFDKGIYDIEAYMDNEENY
jgi:hypothetical protein